jgi:hypothetical protein
VIVRPLCRLDSIGTDRAAARCAEREEEEEDEEEEEGKKAEGAADAVKATHFISDSPGPTRQPDAGASHVPARATPQKVCSLPQVLPQTPSWKRKLALTVLGGALRV